VKEDKYEIPMECMGKGNPILANLFRSFRLAENAGTGFTKMIRGWQIYRGQSPVFHQ
jgi:predicted HTH transcriptional regulator